MALGLIVGLVFVLTAGAVVGAYLLFEGRSDSSALKKTLDHRLLEVTGAARPAADGDDSLIRTQATGPLPLLDRAARQAVQGVALERWVEQSGLRISISALLLIAFVIGLVAALIAARISNMTSVAVLAFFAAASLPFIVVRQKRRSRLYRFEEHFPEALDLISRAIRAGHAFTAGMKMVADEMGQPVGPEFRKSFEEQNFGMSLKDSLNHLALRVPLLDVRFFATAVLIQKETGGNLAEILDNLATVVRERFKIRRQVRTHTAHGRYTGYVLLALPPFLAVALMFLNPEHMELLFKDPIGQALIMGAIVMQSIGWFWIKQVVKIEV
jgi:tight adherence protein B